MLKAMIVCRVSENSQPSTSVSEASTWLSDSERLAQAQERSGNECSSSNSSESQNRRHTGRRKWSETGIELAGIFSKKKEQDADYMTPSEAMKYYHKNFGDDPLYGDLFRKPPYVFPSETGTSARA